MRKKRNFIVSVRIDEELKKFIEEHAEKQDRTFGLQLIHFAKAGINSLGFNTLKPKKQGDLR